MFAFLSTGTELRRFAKGILPRLAVAVMLFIPLLYGVLYLWAFWDPVGNMNHLPVALVNQDTGITVSGKHTSYGDKVADKLYKRQDMKWEKTSAAEAAKGVKNGTYYFSVTIPKNFSKQAASPSTSSPKSPELVVKYNDSNSFLASTLGKQAMAQVREVVGQQFGQKYAKTALVGLQSARSGLSQAADGSGKITKGLKTAKSGTKELNVGLGTLVSGMTELSSGSKTLSTSTQELASGAATLDSGAKSLASGASSANSGAQQLASNLSTAASSTKQLQAGAAKLQAALQKAYTDSSGNTQTLEEGTSELDAVVKTKLETVNEDLNGVDQEVEQLSSKLAAAPETLKTQILGIVDSSSKDPTLPTGLGPYIGISGGSCAMPELTASTTQLTSAVLSACTIHTQKLAYTSTQSELQKLAGYTRQIASGSKTLNTGIATLTAALTKLSSGLDQLSTGASSLASGTSQLSSGASTLASGTSTLSTGASKLATGASTLNSGIDSAASGASSAKSGAQQLADGSGKLLDGSQTLTSRLTSGTNQIPKSSAATVAKQAKVISKPTVLKQSWLHNAKVFGVGFAPFFMSLAMFVGGIITWLLLRALPTRALAAGVNGWRAAMSGFLPAALFGIGQVTIMLGVIVFGLGLSPAYPVTTVLFTLLSCFAFLAMQQMFIITMGPAAGRVVALALLMFQLSSSGGTYPVETTPEFFRVITHIMPITYVVNGLREAITGGIDGRFWIALAVLLFVLFGSLIISAISAARQRQWTIARLHPELVI
ncbi:MAG: YhgE/Pip domain-containing protein [Microbacteriaceae bacterium]|jgi:putative membrane protein|nr:YhgE/Pip domain-containing protein [Microbacteriaceae bacterium]